MNQLFLEKMHQSQIGELTGGIILQRAKHVYNTQQRRWFKLMIFMMC